MKKPIRKKPGIRGGGGAASVAPSAAEDAEPKKSGFKKRTAVPLPEEFEPEVPILPGELGITVNTIMKSKTYGAPFILGSSKRMDRGYNSTGILAVDLGLGGGWRKSSTGMVIGEKSSGKSTLYLRTIARFQRMNPDKYAAWLDIEGTLDKAWARKNGVDMDRLLVVEPETGEHAVDLVDAMLRAIEIGITVTDSIAMLVPMKEIDESAEQETMALQARLMGKFMRKANNAIIKERQRGHEPTLLNINQWRSKVGLVFGDPRSVPGGKIVEFSTTQQLEIKNKEQTEKGADTDTEVVYNQHEVKVTKNKSGGPVKEAMFKLIRQSGFEGMPEGWVDQAKSVRVYASRVGLCDGSPTSYQFDGVPLKFRSAAEFTTWAIENQEAYDDLLDRIIVGHRTMWGL
ncbi:RecA-like DNA recombinase [Rhodobacter phage RcTiptonus]|nr:RecA-like DNA recombinase [Rhodobacter phage RcTiptonus]